MKNNYERNMEEMLQKAFLAQDFEAPKNEILLESSAKATLKGNGAISLFLQSGLFKSLSFLFIGVSLFFIGNHLTADEVISYSPVAWEYELPKEERKILSAIPSRKISSLSLLYSPSKLKSTSPLLFQFPKKAEDTVKVYTPEIEESVVPTLTVEEIQKNQKLKEALLRDVLKLSKDRVSKVNVFTQFLRKGEKKLNDFVVWTGEISNLEYRIFLNDLIVNERINDYHNAKVYSKGWEEFSDKGYLKQMTNLYAWHPAYDKYPVVNISRQGAQLFCKWLTNEIQADTKNKHLLWEVRLPNNREWEYAASGGSGQNIFPWGGPYVRNEKGCFLANYNPLKNNDTLFNVSESSCGGNDGGMLTVGVYSYNPNKFGLFNASGNVSEMVSYPYLGNKIGARGGNWNSVREEIKIFAKESFEGISSPSPLIGFRPIITYRNESTDMGEVERPHLTGEEREANHKRKTKLLKEVLKIDHDWYTNTIRGKMKINGTEEKTVPFLASKHEVSNMKYKTFLFDLIIQERWEDYQEAKPDFALLNQLSLYEKMYPEGYLTNPSFGDYPIVNISVKGAELYGRWLFEEAKKVDSRNRLSSITSIRLPSYEEWIVMASVNGTFQSYPWPTYRYRVSTHKVGQESYMANFYSDQEGVIDLGDNARFTNITGSYYPNRFGIYNLSGNVAEMVRYKDGEYGSKGGSWKSSHEEIMIYAADATKGQLEASPQIGFRVIMELKTQENQANWEELKAFPSLTEEQRIENNKRKADYLKQVLKWNRSYYSNLIHDSIRHESDPKLYRAVAVKTHEVSNLEYKTFLFDLIIQRRYEDFEIAKPDQELWRNVFKKAEPFVEYYFAHESYQNYPVVNVSREAAELYANWLISEARKIDVKEKLRFVESARLPTYNEWMLAASNYGKNKVYPWKGSGVKNSSKRLKGALLANFNRVDSSFQRRDGNYIGTEITTPVNSYWPNEQGIYNMAGNVAEMVQYEDGEFGSKGGSWKSSAEEIRIDAPDYTKGNLQASPTLGFRIVLEWQLKRKNEPIIGVKAMND